MRQTIGTFVSDHGQTEVIVCRYQLDSRCPAVILHSNGGWVATLSVYLEGYIPDEGCFLVKTWSGNEKVAAQALASGLFEDTGQRIPAGLVEAQVWRFKVAV